MSTQAAPQAQLYRTPTSPGYLGAYDWRSTLLGLLCLVIANFAATQYIAAKFQYQPALGTPLLRARSGGVYQPFAWIVWGWRHSSSRDERIRQPLFIGDAIVFGGSVISVIVFFIATNRRSRYLA